GRITPGATSGGATLTLNGANAGANTISGVLADNGAGKLALAKSGAGVWTISGVNTFSGPTTVSAGTLQSANNHALATTPSVAVNNAGSMLAVNYGGASDYTQSQVATLLGKTTFGAGTVFGFDTSNAVGLATY